MDRSIEGRPCLLLQLYFVLGFLQTLGCVSFKDGGIYMLMKGSALIGGLLVSGVHFVFGLL